MSPLGEELRAMIATDGPISVERYMQLCLQHPRHGYYTTRDAIGRDFITAPEVHQMFGELIGLWAAQVWLDIGAPAPIRFVELGPGRGTLMADALRATRIVPGFHTALSVDLVETSPRLEAAQRERLGTAERVAWHRSIDDLPDEPSLIVANEFFDALPVRHYVRSDAGWHDRMVGLGDDGALVFGAARDIVSALVPALVPEAATAGETGQILEVGHAALATMKALAGRIARRGGALLVCDYGHVRTSLGETLQAVRGHRYAGTLDAPGEADLTAHVDFAALARAARETGAAVHGPLGQGDFLRRLGIVERAGQLRRTADPGQSEAIEAALERLASAPCGATASMATLFKVLAVTPYGAPVPPGFETIPMTCDSP